MVGVAGEGLMPKKNPTRDFKKKKFEILTAELLFHQFMLAWIHFL